ncbi:hypothetical protein SLL00_06540 [Metabacillus indicus]|uniref:hypothetical protein n=1 Tax=Metabacillus indicus TaxID=246786 RepID=UPI0029FFFE26|nr:hypothetical protein [Metabacillus indicus]MDX8289442.1 hypothetical protein [Metabacillus indicus]
MSVVKDNLQFQLIYPQKTTKNEEFLIELKLDYIGTDEVLLTHGSNTIDYIVIKDKQNEVVYKNIPDSEKSLLTEKIQKNHSVLKEVRPLIKEKGTYYISAATSDLKINDKEINGKRFILKNQLLEIK